MEEYKIEILKNEELLDDYEQKLYQEYSKDKNNWMMKNYKIVDNKKMRPENISSEYLVHYIALKDNIIIAGMTMHINPKNEFIIEKMGFDIEKDDQTCEGLTIFVIDEYKKDTMNILFKLSDIVNKDIINRGFKRIYTSTPSKYKNLQTMLFDSSILEIKTIENEKRALLLRIVQD